MNKKLRIALIGLGQRGHELLMSTYLEHPDVIFTIVCDVYQDRVDRAADLIAERTGARPRTTLRWQDILTDDEVDALIISTSWETHSEIAIAAMRAGKYVASEVGGAYTLEECWKLVDCYEETKTPIMFLENCMYGRDEMMLMRMVREGVFGQLVHCAGGYQHDLREEITFGKENRHYRLQNYKKRNTENYPTHELGPIAKLLGINRGNRMVSLVSVASKARGLAEYIKNTPEADQSLLQEGFAQGDIVNTIITCADGSTILLTLDTTLPRPYSRGLRIQGTKGMYLEDNGSLFLDTPEHTKAHFSWDKHWNNKLQYREQYEHPLWQSYLASGVKKGHGGMDYLVFDAFVQAIAENKEMPIDVYDMASWMSISALAEESIRKGGAPVAIPDFTKGRWLTRRDEDMRDEEMMHG